MAMFINTRRLVGNGIVNSMFKEGLYLSEIIN